MDAETLYRALADHLKHDEDGLELASRLWVTVSWEERPFLLTAGEHYYPGSGTSNWQGTFATEKKAKEMGQKLLEHDGPGMLGWFKVIDLREWAFPKEGEYCCSLKKEKLEHIGKTMCSVCGSLTQT